MAAHSFVPCGHCFCGECIGDWLTRKTTCPECRWALLAGPLAAACDHQPRCIVLLLQSPSLWRCARASDVICRVLSSPGERHLREAGLSPCQALASAGPCPQYTGLQDAAPVASGCIDVTWCLTSSTYAAHASRPSARHAARPSRWRVRAATCMSQKALSAGFRQLGHGPLVVGHVSMSSTLGSCTKIRLCVVLLHNLHCLLQSPGGALLSKLCHHQRCLLDTTIASCCTSASSSAGHMLTLVLTRMLCCLQGQDAACAYVHQGAGQCAACQAAS